MNRQKHTIVILFVVGLLIFILYSVSVQANKDASIYADPYKDHMDLYNTEVVSKSISSAEKEDLTLRMQPFIERATKHAEAQQQRIRGTEPTIDRTPHIITVHKLPDGIDEHPAIPLKYYSDVELTNAWRRTVGDTTYQVYVGVLKTDRSQGIVLLQDPIHFGFFRKLSPQKVGILRILDYQDFTVILASEKGDTLYFDVIGQEFIDSLDEAKDPSELLQIATPVPNPSDIFPTVTVAAYPGP